MYVRGMSYIEGKLKEENTMTYSEGYNKVKETTRPTVSSMIDYAKNVHGELYTYMREQEHIIKKQAEELKKYQHSTYALPHILESLINNYGAMAVFTELNKKLYVSAANLSPKGNY